jgi:hypothetical protein
MHASLYYDYEYGMMLCINIYIIYYNILYIKLIVYTNIKIKDQGQGSRDKFMGYGYGI